MFAVAAVIAIEDDERVRRREVLRELYLERRHLRDTSDPFNLEPEYFRRLYRMPPQLVLNLVDRSRDALEPDIGGGVPPHLQVLCSLRFYAEGSYQKGLGQDYQHPLSQTMVSRIIERVTNAIGEIADDFIRFPMTREDRQRTQQEFRQHIRIPGILGLIGCFLVSLRRPTKNEEAFYNYKGYHAVNVQVVSDANYSIQNLRICPGSNNDRHVWQHSDMKYLMETLRGNDEITRVEGRYYLLGDSGYTPSPIMLTPIRNAEEGKVHARTRADTLQSGAALWHVDCYLAVHQT